MLSRARRKTITNTDYVTVDLSSCHRNTLIDLLEEKRDEEKSVGYDFVVCTDSLRMR